MSLKTLALMLMLTFTLTGCAASNAEHSVTSHRIDNPVICFTHKKVATENLSMVVAKQKHCSDLTNVSVKSLIDEPITLIKGYDGTRTDRNISYESEVKVIDGVTYLTEHIEEYGEPKVVAHTNGLFFNHETRACFKKTGLQQQVVDCPITVQ